MAAQRETPEPRRSAAPKRRDPTGLWVRATIAALLLASAAITTAYVLHAEDVVRERTLASRSTSLEGAEPLASPPPLETSASIRLPVI